MKKTHWIAGLLALATTTAHAGAWTPKQGSSYNKFAFNDYAAKRFYGTPDPGFEEFTSLGVSYYGEYAPSDGLALFASVPFNFLSRKDNGTTTRNNGIADIDVGARYRWVEKPFVLSSQVLLKLPYAYRSGDPLALGNGQEDIELRGLIGKSFGFLGYAGAEAAYRRRLGAPADEFRYLFEVGTDLSPSYYLRAKFDGIQSIGNSDSGTAGSGNPTLNLEFDLGRADFSAGWRISERWGSEFTYTLPVYGRNTLRGETLQFALIFTP